MKFELITLQGKKKDETVYEVILPTAAGEISVFPNHEPLVSLIIPGVIAIRQNKEDSDEKLDYFATSGGVLEINHVGVRALVDEADASEDIVEAEVQAALERAKNLREEATTQVELDEAKQLIDRHATQLKVAELRRRHHR